MSIEDSPNNPDEYGLFAGTLEQTGQGRRETFHQLESRPDLFIRRMEIKRHDAEFSKWSAEQFEKLRDLGVKVPNFSSVTGEDERGMAEFLIVDRVMGESLDTLTKAKADLPADSVNRTFKGILTYIQEAQQKDEPVLWDLALRQFMYGHTARETEDDIYLVDIDPTFRKVGGEILGRVENMMTTLHESVPIQDESWELLGELMIANDTTYKATEEELEETRAWIKENFPPKPQERP